MAEGSIFEILWKQYERKLPFVAYRKPNENRGTAFLQRSAEVFHSKDLSESGFVFAPFDDSKEIILFPEEVSEKHLFEPPIHHIENSGITAEKATAPSEETKLQHIRLVEKGLEKLQSKSLEKVVLSRKEPVLLEKADPVTFFSSLLQSYPAAFVYVWYHPKVGCWLAATPEILLKVAGNRFKTMALAGTQKFMGNMEVQWGEKEKQEQQFVTDSILENLKKAGISSGNIETSKVYTTKAGNLLHLRTDISGSLDHPKEGIKKIIAALHPTPAVCGLPTKKAKEFILSGEGYDREFYTGYLGELNIQQSTSRSRSSRNVENLAYRTVKKETALYVNLRCMKLEGNTANLFIGGGITKDSIPTAEWEETVNKAQTMKKVLFN